jgi:hypothetical protein
VDCGEVLEEHLDRVEDGAEMVHLTRVRLQVMLPRFWVASTKQEAALVRSQGWAALERARVGSGAA